MSHHDYWIDDAFSVMVLGALTGMVGAILLLGIA